MLFRSNGWYSQFGTREERFFAATILHRLTLRTKKQFNASIQALYRGPISHLFFPNDDDLHLLRMLTGRIDPKIRLVPVLRQVDPPTKSGVVVLRKLQRLLRINSKWLAWPWQAEALMQAGDIHKIIFVDDFLGSGSQFGKFFESWNFKDLLSDQNMLYAPITAHAQGWQTIQIQYPELLIATSELLDEECHFFAESSWTEMCRGGVSAKEAEVWYLDFAQEHSLVPTGIGPLGVGDMGLTYGFEHSTPNNSLPALWYSGADWCPLLDR